MPSICGALVSVGIGLVAAALPAAADEAVDEEHWRVVFELENDVLVDRDRHYTSGVFLSALAPSTWVPDWIGAAAIVLPPYDDDPSDLRWGFAFGHEIYTPSTSEAKEVIPDDRPYAGYLYLRFELHRDRYRDVAKKIPFLDSLSIDLGVVGPAALGKEFQDLFHVIFPSPNFRGWDNQLENEFALVLRRERHWRIPGEPIEIVGGIGVDAIANLTAELGNVRTAGTLGLTLRAGWRLPSDFGQGRFSPRDDWDQGFRLFVFAGAELSGVARDIFLDGNTFRDSHDVDKNAMVIRAPFGIAIARGRVRSSLSVIWKSEEFDGQDDADLYGNLSIVVDY
jgi:lipid A 3-O-deacylase